MSDLGNKEIMAQNIKHFLEAKGVSASEVCEVLNVPKATFSNWCTAKTYPRIDKIELMARYFGINKSDLVERPNKNDLLNRAFNERPEMRILFSTMEDATTDEINQAIKIIEALKNK